MKRGLSPSWLRLFALGFMIWGPVLAQSARVAVSGDSSLANLIDVTSVELAKLPELSVLDRADLNKLGQEQEIESVLNSQNFTPIQLLPADGLVLLRVATANGKTGVFARLVAVQPGIILREVALPDGDDPVAQAQALEKEFAPYWPKLAALQKGKVEALSLLGLRFEVDAPETHDVERRMNLLLSSRLSAEPDVLVLERWRLNDVVFEKSLAPQQPSPFWTGSSLIDGSMQMKNGLIVVTLRLRPPHGTEISVTDQDTPENLPALVGRLADKIQNHPNSPEVWKPAIEATHYAELGKWCLDNRLFEEGAEAIESALALGDNSRATRVLQVQASALLAYPDDLRGFDITGDNYRLGHVTANSLSLRVPAATRAAELTREYMKTYRDFSSPTPTPEDPIDQGLAVLNTALRILCAAYDNRFQMDHSDDVTTLRHVAQKLIGDLGDRLLSGPPSRQRKAFLRYRAYYAGLWHETPEETLAFYREILKPGQPDGAWIRAVMFEAFCLRWPYLDSDNKPDANLFPWPSIGTPWIVAWDGRSREEVKTLWQNFVRERAASPDPVLQCDALKGEFSSDQTLTGRDAVLARTITFLQQHTDSLSGTRGNELAAGIMSISVESERGQNGALRDELIALYLKLLQQHEALTPAWIEEAPRLLHFPGDLPAATTLLAALNDYEQWYRAQTPQDDNVPMALAKAKQTLYRNKPELVSATTQPTGDFLPVTRFCEFWQSDADRSTGQRSFDPLTLRSAENHLWFLTAYRPHKVFCLDPASMQVVSSYPLPAELDPVHPTDAEHYRDLQISPQWLAVALNGQVLLCSRSDNQWRALEVPPSSYMPRWIDQQLYLLYNARYGDRLISFNANNGAATGSGLIRVSLPDGACENVISSRRIPPQNALDGQPLGMPLDLWATSKGLSLAFEDRPIYTSPDGKNFWSPVTTAPTRQRLRVIPGGVLIEEDFTAEIFGQLKLLTDGGARVLLSDDSGAQDAEKPLWNFPPGLSGHHFPEEIAAISPVMRGDDLCFYFKFKRGMSDGKQDCLYYFAKGQKNGLKIPLAYDVQKLSSNQRAGFPETNLSFNTLQMTDYGLIMGEYMRGYWVIPWSDIDAYRAKTHPAE